MNLSLAELLSALGKNNLSHLITYSTPSWLLEFTSQSIDSSPNQSIHGSKTQGELFFFFILDRQSEPYAIELKIKRKKKRMPLVLILISLVALSVGMY